MSLASLFSGCGGLDLGFINAGFNIVYANDFDKYAVQSYRHNLGNHIHLGDITEIQPESIPEHNILIGGFPCQPFSMMGQQRGFLDGVRGTLFFNVAQIIQYHMPKVVVLENVRNLRTHDNGNTLATIINTLENIRGKGLGNGYNVHYDIYDSKDYGVPQTRNRIFLVCIRNDIDVTFTTPNIIPIDVEINNLQSILEENVNPKYYLSHRILPTILAHGTGNYYSRSEIDLQIARPLTATMAKMHRANQDNYVTQPSEDAVAAGKTNIRRLTPRECARLQGFPEDFEIVVSDSQAYKQFGNAVTVNVAEAIANRLIELIPDLIEE